MEKIKVLTSQNVAIEYPLAKVGERMISNFIDYLIIAGYYLVIIIFVNVFEYFVDRTFWVIVGTIPLFYQLVCEIFLNGQSIGMRARKIKVIRLDGKELSVGNCLVRWMLRPIDILLLSGSVAVVSITASKLGQRIGDMAAGTTVVKEKNEMTLVDTIFNPSAMNYTPVFTQVSKLKDSDIEIIKDSILISEQSGNRHTAFATCKKIEHFLQIQNTTPADPVKFLKTIMKDYNHVTATM